MQPATVLRKIAAAPGCVDLLKKPVNIINFKEASLNTTICLLPGHPFLTLKYDFMKLSKAAVGIFTVLLLGTVGSMVFLLAPQTQFNYMHIRVDAPTAARLNTNFKRLVLNSQVQTNPIRNKVVLTPYIEVTAGSAGDYSALLSVYAASTPFPSNKPLSSYEVTKIQVVRLMAIPGVAYLILSPVLYPADNRFIAYQIKAYNASNVLIAIDAAYMKLNPCPPARGYSE